tara:strand:+ start:39 stop:230 length:192 start_codon:yes stop_codon:yes gene_type:complete
MKNILIGIILMMLVGCAIPENPRLSVGKKCVVKEKDVVYSYVWLYNKETGLEANKETCKVIED